MRHTLWKNGVRGIKEKKCSVYPWNNGERVQKRKIEFHTLWKNGVKGIGEKNCSVYPRNNGERVQKRKIVFHTLWQSREWPSDTMRIMLRLMLMSRCRAMQMHSNVSACEQAPVSQFDASAHRSINNNMTGWPWGGEIWKKSELVLLTFVPILVGYLINATFFIPVIGTLLFYILPIVVLAFWFWLGSQYSKTDWGMVPSILIGSATGVLSLALYLWQF